MIVTARLVFVTKQQLIKWELNHTFITSLIQIGYQVLVRCSYTYSVICLGCTVPKEGHCTYLTKKMKQNQFLNIFNDNINTYSFLQFQAKDPKLDLRSELLPKRDHVRQAGDRNVKSLNSYRITDHADYIKFYSQVLLFIYFIAFGH